MTRPFVILRENTTGSNPWMRAVVALRSTTARSGEEDTTGGSPWRFINKIAVIFGALALGLLIIFPHSAAKAAGTIKTYNLAGTVEQSSYEAFEGSYPVGFSVSLSEKPSSDVKVSVSVSGNAPITLTKGSSLTFTTSNWSTKQKITVQENSVKKGQTATISFKASGYTTKTIAYSVVATVTVTSVGSGTTVVATIDPASLAGTSFTLDELFTRFINVFIWIIGVAAFAGILYSGVMYITAGGDSAKAETARKNLTWSIIGILLAISSYAVVTFVAGWLNIDTTRTTATSSPTTASTTSWTSTPGSNDETAMPTSFTSTPGSSDTGSGTTSP